MTASSASPTGPTMSELGEVLDGGVIAGCAVLVCFGCYIAALGDTTGYVISLLATLIIVTVTNNTP